MTTTKNSETKTIAVIGAAGATGGELARAILDDPGGGYTCRAITRTQNWPAARALADRAPRWSAPTWTTPTAWSLPSKERTARSA